MAVQLNPNVVTTATPIDQTRALENATDVRARAPDAVVGVAQPVSDHVVRVQDNATKVNDEIRADARKELPTFRGIGAPRNAQAATATPERIAPPPTDTARVEAQVAQSEGGQKASQAASATTARTDAATLQTGETGKAVEASGAQSDASDG